MAEGFSRVAWQLRYCTSALNRNGQPTDVLHDFYIPSLQRAVRYDRVAGYFRSTSLAAASQGYTAFLHHNGKMRLIAGADMQLQDVAAILRGNQQRLSDRLMAELEAPEQWPEPVQSGVALLCEMVASGHMEIRVAFRVSAATGEAILADSCEDGYVHEKWLIMTDAEGNRLYGSGSLNESRTALTMNAENIDIHCDWKSDDARERTDAAQRDFENLWSNHNPHIVVMPVPEAVKRRLVQLRTLRNQPTEIDGTILPLEVKMTPKERLQFAVLHDAPHMPGGEFIGMYSAPIEPWQHQEIVSRRLIDSYPYSYLLCDEVGLGKTIEAALAIRSLVLSGRTKRVLIVAPASLTEQWHRELAQKAMLPFALSRVKPGGSGKYVHSYIYPGETQTTDEDLYGPDLNIVSSGLVRRKDRLPHLRAAEDFDIVLLDEAHYARRQNPRDGAAGNPKYGDLYIVLQNALQGKTKSLWLATATPMQIDPIEVYDLFKLTNRVGQFGSDPTLVMEYFQGLGSIANQEQLTRQYWTMMGQSFLQIEKLDPYLWGYLQKTVVTAKNRKVLRDLPVKDPHHADLRQLIQPMFAASPLSRVMMRHTRSLLEIYRQNGKLTSNLARRHVRPVCAIEFTDAEAEFYQMLEDYCRGLGEQIRKYNPETKQVMIFLLNFLQLRFASSFYAIQKTLERRLKRVQNTLLFGHMPETEEELKEMLEGFKGEDDEYSEGDLNDITMDALLKDRTKQDLEWEKKRLTGMLRKLDAIHETPSKMQKLLEELSRRRMANGRLRQTVLFTRFYDTLWSIRKYLSTRDPSMRVGIYAGGNRAKWFDSSLQRDRSATHEEIKVKFLSGEIDILLCTDAAAEGLNLQTADLLINFDLGWNPMKIEQRIGRIDRIGQKHADIEVVNMCYVGSTEQIVYGRLLERLQKANLIVGTQQISLLPVTQEDFRKLQTGEITPENLEKESIRRLEKQKAINARMEMSAEDIYQMYSRMSDRLHAESYPATTDDLWDCMTRSVYLKGHGARLGSDGIWSIPASDSWGSVQGSHQRDERATAAYVSWDHAGVGELLAHLSKHAVDVPYIKRITALDEKGISAFAVSTAEGPKLITAYAQIESVNIDSSKALSADDIRSCETQLSRMLEEKNRQQHLLQQSAKMNTEIASLHAHFLTQVTLDVLKQLEASGCSKAKDAIKQLEMNARGVYYVDITDKEFSGRASDMLFQISESGGDIHVTVYGILLNCVIELTKRETAAIRGKTQDKDTADVIRRLERR